MIFNLKDYLQIATMTKEAMAGKARRYRDQTKWCRLDDAVKGNEVAIEYEDQTSQTWSELMKEVPGTEGVLYELLAFREEKRGMFKSRYGDPVEKINDYFQVIVGFNPIYGMYVISVGPYTATTNAWLAMLKYAQTKGQDEVTQEILDMAERDDDIANVLGRKPSETKKLQNNAKQVKGDMANKFAYFTKRYCRATPEEISASSATYMKKLTAGLSSIMPLSNVDLQNTITNDDMQIDVKQATGKIRGEDKNEKNKAKGKPVTEVSGQLAFTKKNYPSLDQNSVSGQSLYGADYPVLGLNSEIRLNPKGIKKIMSMASKTGNFEGALNIAIKQAAQVEEIPEANIEAHLNSNMGFWKTVLGVLKNYQGEQVGQEDPSFKLAKSIANICLNDNNTTAVGSQQMESMRTKESQIHMAEFNVEVLETFMELGKNPIFVKHNNKDRARLVANAMQAKRDAMPKSRRELLKAKGVINPDVIEAFIENLKREKAIIGKKGFVVGKKNYALLLDEARSALKQVTEGSGSKYNEGFFDMDTCIRMACAYYTDPRSDALKERQNTNTVGEEGDETQSIGISESALETPNVVDPITKAKLYMPLTGIFRTMSGGQRVTTHLLTQKRLNSTGGRTTKELIEGDQIAKKTRMSPALIKDMIVTRGEDSITIEEQNRQIEQKVERIETEEDFTEVPIQTEIGENGEEVQVQVDLAKEEEEANKTEEFPVEEIVPDPVNQVENTEQVPVAGQEDFPVEEIQNQNVEQGITQEQPQQPQQPLVQTPEVSANEQNEQNADKKKKRKNVMENANNLVANTLKTLVKIAKELDDKGKGKAAEEIHSVIRKYQKRI